MNSIRRYRVLLLACLCSAVAVVTGCGGDEQSTDQDPRSLLKTAASKQLESGEIRLRATTDIPGFPILGDKWVAAASGPFETRKSGTELDWDVDLRAGGQSFPARLTVTRGQAYVDFQGLSYKADEDLARMLPIGPGGGVPTLDNLGADPTAWFDNLRVEDGEDIGGDDTHLVTGKVDEEALLRSLAEAADRPGVRKRLERSGGPLTIPKPDDANFGDLAHWIEKTRIEVNVDEDGYARRVFATLGFRIPEGVEGTAFDHGTLSFEMVVEKVGARVDVVPPSNPRPLSDLLNFAGLIFGVEKPSDLWTVPR